MTLPKIGLLLITMSVTRLTQNYIAEHPSIKDCLRRGFINYSALSREVCSHYGIDRFDAVLVACRRIYKKIRSQAPQEKRIVNLIKRAKLRSRNKIMVGIIEKPRDYERLYTLQRDIKRQRGDFHLVEGEEAITIISNSEYAPDLRDAFKGRILKLTLDLTQITMIFDERIESTPGVVSYIYGLLSDHGINVQEEMSCWTDLIIVIDESDASKAMRVLSLSSESGKE